MSSLFLSSLRHVLFPSQIQWTELCDNISVQSCTTWYLETLALKFICPNLYVWLPDAAWISASRLFSVYCSRPDHQTVTCHHQVLFNNVARHAKLNSIKPSLCHDRSLHIAYRTKHHSVRESSHRDIFSHETRSHTVFSSAPNTAFFKTSMQCFKTATGTQCASQTTVSPQPRFRCQFVNSQLTEELSALSLPLPTRSHKNQCGKNLQQSNSSATHFLQQ